VPDDCLGILLGKSTYARCMLLVNTTWLEPGWRGKVTLELTNLTDRYLKLYVGEGIAQVSFLTGQACETTYAGKKGKYQGQKGVTPAVVK
jgi:dCTP deaminase